MNSTSQDVRVLAICGVMVTGALLVVGVVSHELVRHIVQTSPLWIVIVLGIRNSALAKWAALPCFAFWLLLMIAIWLYLLGWARIISGTFSVTETAMTLVVGVASIVGIVTALRTRSATGRLLAAGTAFGVMALQIAALRISLLPQIAHR